MSEAVWNGVDLGGRIEEECVDGWNEGVESDRKRVVEMSEMEYCIGMDMMSEYGVAFFIETYNPFNPYSHNSLFTPIQPHSTYSLLSIPSRNSNRWDPTLE